MSRDIINNLNKEDIEIILNGIKKLNVYFIGQPLGLELESIKRLCKKRLYFLEKEEEELKNNFIEINGEDDLGCIRLVSRYFENEIDFINVIKVNKKFKNLCEEFYFNPISNTEMFPNIREQHIYSANDIILNNINKYVVWYKTNEIFTKNGTQICGDIIFKKNN